MKVCIKLPAIFSLLHRLEYALRKFACLTVDDMIVITYNDMRFELKVLETQPKTAVRIIECDMSVRIRLIANNLPTHLV